MYLNKISLVNFKNYAQAELTLSPKINCFVGNNGVGKTNLLDAIYYLSFCKSYFYPSDSQNIKHSEKFFVLQGNYSRKEEQEQIYCGMKRGQKKQFKRNKKEYTRLSEHIGLLPLVMVSPNDTVLITGGSEERRKFMDGVISQYDRQYLDTLIRYNRVLQQRNQLLKNFHKNNNFEPAQLEVWTEQLARLGHIVFEKRKEFITKFLPIFNKYYKFISQEHETVGLTYESKLANFQMLDLLAELLPKDRGLQYTSAGTHRDDLQFLLGDYQMRKIGSQGQQKTYLVALKLAQFEFIKTVSGFNPIILMDDIFDKLDENRVLQIITLVASIESNDNKAFGQIFITDKSKNSLTKLLEKSSDDYKVFTVVDGVISEETDSSVLVDENM